MARATRLQLIKLGIDKPIEFAFLFAFLAGVQEGILKPFFPDEKFGEDSLFYLGRYAVYYLFFSNMMIDMFAGVWMKLQQDDRLDSLGSFDVMPTKEDIDKKFAQLRWYWKQFFSKDNSLLENYKYSSKIILVNILPALLLISILNLATLGRLDLDSYIAAYLVIFATGLEGLRYKAENAFEKSANFALKDFIEKGVDFDSLFGKRMSAHPLFQMLKARKITKARLAYNSKYVFFENIIGLLTEVLANVDTEKGSRAFFKNTSG